MNITNVFNNGSSQSDFSIEKAIQFPSSNITLIPATGPARLCMEETINSVIFTFAKVALASLGGYLSLSSKYITPYVELSEGFFPLQRFSQDGSNRVYSTSIQTSPGSPSLSQKILKHKALWVFLMAETFMGSMNGYTEADRSHVSPITPVIASGAMGSLAGSITGLALFKLIHAKLGHRFYTAFPLGALEGLLLPIGVATVGAYGVRVLMHSIWKSVGISSKNMAALSQPEV